MLYFFSTYLFIYRAKDFFVVFFRTKYSRLSDQVVCYRGMSLRTKMLLKIITFDRRNVRPNRFASYVFEVCCPIPLKPSVSTKKTFKGSNPASEAVDHSTIKVQRLVRLGR